MVTLVPHDPTSPLRAHHRLLREMLSGEGLDPRPGELDTVSRVFERAGGSWVGFYDGSTKDVSLLKRCLKVAVKNGFFTKAPKWGE